MNMRKAILFVILISFLAVSSFAQADLQPAAIVNLTKNEPITVKQLRSEVERMEKTRGRALTKDERLQLLDVMINERLAIQAAEKEKIVISENEVNQQVQQLRSVLAQQLGRQPTDAEFNQAVKNESGMELAAFKEQLRRQMIVQKYLLAKKEPLLKSVKEPTEADIIDQFNLAKAQFVRPETIRFSMIQVPYGPDAASRAKARELANSLLKEIGSNPSKFDEVVTKSHAPNSGYIAGDGGFLPRNHEAQNVVGQDFINTAFSLKQGEVSKLIEGNPGYQIIKVTENYSMKNLELDDIIQPGSSVRVRDYIKQALLNERQQAVLTKASEELISDLRKNNPFRVYDNNLNW
jgi:parvulin-like peptidyl-prolyl isomerase